MSNTLVDYAIKHHKAIIDDSPYSSGFITISANVQKTVLSASEYYNIKRFNNYKDKLQNNYVLVYNLLDNKKAKILRSSNASRYFTNGRKKIKAKIYKRLGRWTSVPGLLLTLTFDPKRITRRDAWENLGELKRTFLKKINMYRQYHGRSKVKCLAVIEAQKKTGYPHIHIVFPYLRYLANIDYLSELWGQGNNAVDITIRDGFSPVRYITKYITKIEGWSDLALSYIWTNRTRLYSYSNDYRLPYTGDRRVPEWQFSTMMSTNELIKYIPQIQMRHDIVNQVDCPYLTYLNTSQSLTDS